MKRSGLFWQPEGATKTNFLRDAWLPPIKAICRWPGKQKKSSGCLKPIKGTLFQESDPSPSLHSEHHKLKEPANNKERGAGRAAGLLIPIQSTRAGEGERGKMQSCVPAFPMEMLNANLWAFRSVA